jgi:hypothetical protein
MFALESVHLHSRSPQQPAQCLDHRWYLCARGHQLTAMYCKAGWYALY